MKRFLTKTVAVVELMVAQVADGQAASPPSLVVDGSADGQNNRLTVDPSKGQNVVINNSGDGRGNKICGGPGPGRHGHHQCQRGWAKEHDRGQGGARRTRGDSWQR
jgi:hypothetical protein